MGNSKNNLQKDAALKRKVNKLENALSAARGEGLSAETLRNEHNFVNYLKMLKGFAQRYCVIVAANDTPWGYTFTPELTQMMTDVGFKVDLYGKFRCAYAAVINCGELIFEKLEEDTKKIINVTLCLSNSEITLVSIGFDAMNLNNKSRIEINNKIFSQKARGLNFVVFDPVTQAVIDSINFDIFSASISSYRFSDYPQKIKAFTDAHPGVTVIPFALPNFPKENLSAGERSVKENNIRWAQEQLSHAINTPGFPLRKYYDSDGITEVLSIPKSYFDANGVRRFEDTYGQYVNTFGGHRVTNYQPQTFNNCIYMVAAGCLV